MKLTKILAEIPPASRWPSTVFSAKKEVCGKEQQLKKNFKNTQEKARNRTARFCSGKSNSCVTLWTRVSTLLSLSLDQPILSLSHYLLLNVNYHVFFLVFRILCFWHPVFNVHDTALSLAGRFICLFLVHFLLSFTFHSTDLLCEVFFFLFKYMECLSRWAFL